MVCECMCGLGVTGVAWRWFLVVMVTKEAVAGTQYPGTRDANNVLPKMPMEPCYEILVGYLNAEF